MPGLDGNLIRQRLADATLYLCTPDRPDLAEFADAALAGGVDIIQLRDKSLEAKQEIEAIEILAEATERHGRLLAVNDRADIAHAVQADVLHLGQDDLPVPLARRIVGDDVVIGRSTHDVDQMTAAAAEPGVDYFCTGPCWPTPTKPGRPAPGLDLVRATKSERPWFAIGGIDLTNLREVLQAGATRVVVVRAITDAEDPRRAAESFKVELSS
ncbi:thiamine phosphate synthase [Lentzea flaviverrucosa]|uniref:Thiamine-phosphate synthase n=1 Tax=Lentzea flaviverrucosa TaxID=200379 RepID=A0A1H9LLT2_9PSEU|nr:thiamine phosphate synthase [Lentzea flaviverrucosa]RDI31269.1 thiamine-phosphate pyrophosphorylase [Lentzea flaviverrucosa]SER12157.1 thiamine-phosphate pyrophosphorylase [Lentzea flaviverrucosa]